MLQLGLSQFHIFSTRLLRLSNERQQNYYNSYKKMTKIYILSAKPVFNFVCSELCLYFCRFITLNIRM